MRRGAPGKADLSGWARTLPALILTVLPACRSGSARPQPALITHPTAASRADLERAVSEALHGAPVRLADDALTRDSWVVVGRAEARDINGMPLNGRELGRPQHFQLLRRGTQCVLLHIETGKSLTLPLTTCRVSPKARGAN